MESTEQAAAMPPLGYVTTFDQNSDLWPSLIAVSVISLVIMTLALVARLYVEGFKCRKLGWEQCMNLSLPGILKSNHAIFVRIRSGNRSPHHPTSV